MTRINTLLFLFMLEAIAVLLGLSIYLFIKCRKKTVAVADNGSTNNLNTALEDEAARLETESAAIGHDALVSEEAIIKKEIINAKLQSVKTVMEALKGIKGDETSFWNYFYNDFDKVLGKHFTELMEVARETMAPAPAPAPSTNKKEDSAKIEQAITAVKKKQAIELLGYKEMFVEMNEEFNRIKAFNEKIMLTLEDLAVDSEELQNVIMEFEKVNKKMDKCVNVLNKGSETLDRQMAYYDETASAKNP
ncbi:MAG: hypothetical protein HQL00_15245 [Nitrospirae bacterium]|nr:hypothetical protein [Nitrospirota bacterium]